MVQRVIYLLHTRVGRAVSVLCLQRAEDGGRTRRRRLRAHNNYTARAAFIHKYIIDVGARVWGRGVRTGTVVLAPRPDRHDDIYPILTIMIKITFLLFHPLWNLDA